MLKRDRGCCWNARDYLRLCRTAKLFARLCEAHLDPSELDPSGLALPCPVLPHPCPVRPPVSGVQYTVCHQPMGWGTKSGSHSLFPVFKRGT